MRRNLREKLGPRGARTRSISSEQRRGRSKSPKEEGLERRTVFKRLEKGVFHRLRDKEKNVSAHSRGSERKSYYSSRREAESCYQSSRSKETEIASEKHRYKREYSRRTEAESKSQGSAGGHWKSKPKKQKSSVEDDLSQPWVCEETDPFTPRICYFDFPKTRMPSHIKTYDGNEDPEDHLKIFQAAAKTERWAMPTWSHMFNSTLTENARKKCIQDLVEIHNIKQRNRESTKEFVMRFKLECRDVKVALECMKISGFMHKITNPELIKRLNDKIPQSMDEMMSVTAAFLRGEMAASNRERKKSFPLWKQETGQKQNFKRGNFQNEQRKFCEFHGEVGAKAKQQERSGKDIKEGVNLRKRQTAGNIDGSTMAKNSEAKDHSDFLPGINIAASKDRRRGTLNIRSDEFHGGKITLSLQRDYRKVGEQTIAIGSTLTEEGRNELCGLLRRHLDVFAWKPTNMTGVPRHIAEHRLNVHEGCLPMRQEKKRRQAPERNKAISEEVRKLVEAGIMIEVHYHSCRRSIQRNETINSGASHANGAKEKKDLIIYLAAAKEAINAMLMTERDGKQVPIYFVSRALQGPEVNCTPMEKLILALVSTSKRLKRYFQAHTIVMITDQPIKQLLSNPKVTRRLLKWRFELGEHDIQFRPRTSVKGQILVDFIVERPKDGTPDTPIEDREELPDPWILVMDMCGRLRGRSNNHESGRDGVHLCSKCKDCQVHRPVPKNPQEKLTPITSPWPFYKWGIDIVGPFLEGPGKQFRDNPFKDWCEKLNIRQCFAFVKHPRANGLVERANRSLGEGIKARLGEKNKSWVEEVSHVLWAHRTMIKSSNGKMLFSLTYGTKAIIPAEIGMPTLRTTEVDVNRNNKALGISLDLLEEKREQAAIQEARSKARMKGYYNAGVRSTSFRPGDLVYQNNEASHVEGEGKLGPKWEGPYKVTEVLGNGAYKFKDRSGLTLLRTWNIRNLRKCYIHEM
nr:reverse transcriptase domain-containing protein [Tanacetum cinerariifolium]